MLNGLPPDVTLEDLLASILSKTAYDWEALPLPGFPIQDFSDDGGINDYDVDFTLTGDAGRLGARRRSRSRSRTAHATSRARAACRREERALPDPTLNKGNELEWQLTDVPLNSDV